MELMLDNANTTFLCTIGLADGSVVAATPNPAVSTELLLEIMDWQCEGATVNDVCARLRQRTVPPGYSFHTRIPGIDSPCSTKPANFIE